MRNLLEQKINRMQGQVAVEFLIVLPAFLFVILISLEFAFMYIDRHFVRYAAYEAGRVYVGAFDGAVCSQSQNNLARHAAVSKIAAIAPPVSRFAGEFGLNLRVPSPSLGQNGLSLAAKHLFERYGPAYALTHVKCRPVSDRSVEVEVVYFRSARMPFVKHVLWALHVMKEFNQFVHDQGLDNLGRFKLDRSYRNIYFDPKQIGAGTNALAVQSQMTKILNYGQQLNLNLSQLSGALSQAQMFQNDVQQKVNEITTSANQQINQISGDLNDQITVVNALIYAIPESLRLVPLRVKIRMQRPLVDRFDDAEWRGQAFGVADFSRAPLDENWREWAINLGQVSGQL